MTARLIGRRRFLGTVGAAAAALPFLSALGTRAEPLAAPRRFISIFTPNGVYGPEWFPQGGERDFRLGRILEPLEAWRDHLVVLGSEAEPGLNEREHIGVSIKSWPELPSSGHPEGISSVLTGAPSADFAGQPWATHASVDQVIASHIGGETRFPSLELGVRVQGIPGWKRHISYRGPGMALPAENDPRAVFERVFGSISASPGEAAARHARQQRLVDFLHGRFSDLRPQLSTADRRLLDAHTEALHEVEGRLLTASAADAACAPGEPPHVPEAAWEDYSNMPAIFRAQIDNTVMAMACDLTRVATLQVTEAASNARYGFLSDAGGAPIGEAHHGLSHEPSTNTDAMDKLVRIGRWHSEQVAYLLDRLQATPDVDGRSMLDNTLVLWVNELSDGMFHTHQRMPFLLAGGSGGTIPTGRYLRVRDEPHGKLLLACVQAMGIDAPSFGPPGFEATEPLPGLLG